MGDGARPSGGAATSWITSGRTRSNSLKRIVACGDDHWAFGVGLGGLHETIEARTGWRAGGRWYAGHSLEEQGRCAPPSSRFKSQEAPRMLQALGRKNLQHPRKLLTEGSVIKKS